MLCLKKRRTYSFTQGACAEAPRQSRHRSVSSSKRDGRAEEQRYSEGIAVAVATLPRKLGPREERSSAMVLTVTEDTPADMLAGSMELLVQMPRDHQVQTQRVTVQRSTPMMDLLVQITTAHKLAASSYTLQAIGERGLVLHHQPNTPIGALDALQVKLLPKQGTFLQRKSRQTNQPFETTFRLQVHLPRNQLYVSRVSPKTNLGEILDEVCREKNLDRNKYELRHPANLAETLDLSLTLQDYHLQEVTLCPRQQSRTLMGSALSSQDIMALQKQEECRRQQAQRNSGGGVFGFMFKKSKESSVSTDSLGNRSVSPARSDETARSASPQQQQQQLMRNNFNGQQMPPNRPLRKRRPAPKPPTQGQQLESKIEQTTTVSRTQSKSASDNATTTTSVPGKDKIVISHSRNSSDSSGYHEASVLSDNPDNNGQGGRMPETLPRRGRMQGILEAPRKLAHTSQASKSLGNLAMASSQAGTLSRGVSNTSLSSAGQRKKRAAPPPPIARPLPSAISTQGLERIVDSDESLTSDMDLSKPSSDIDASASKASSDIVCSSHVRGPIAEQPEDVAAVEPARVGKRACHTIIIVNRITIALAKELAPPVPKPRKVLKASPTPSAASSPVSVDPPDSRASCSPCPSASASFGLPSLTEDEREEIAMAIDSIVEAAKGHDFDSLNSNDDESLVEVVKRRMSEALDEVFVEDVKKKEDDEVSVTDVVVKAPPMFEDDSVTPTNEHDGPKEASEEVKHLESATEEAAKEVKFELADDTDSKPPSCAVISTIPKCDHVEPYTDGDFGMSLESNDSNGKKQRKVVRSQSEMSHFDFGPAEKHSRHLTTQGEAFTFALNPNLGEAATKSIEASIQAGSGIAPPTDTDILLQKVSDTLSHSLTPPSPPPTPEETSILEVPNFVANNATINSNNAAEEKVMDVKNVSNAKESRENHHQSTLASESSNNATLGSQQDTSDYVSANGEDLSIGDWEYQIPAPPSAFRDDDNESSVEEKVSVQPVREPISIEAEVHQTTTSAMKPIEPPAEPKPSPPEQKPVVKAIPSVDQVDFVRPKPPPKLVTTSPQLSTTEVLELSKKAEVISELETKINSHKPIIEPVVARDDESYAPKIAPVENNLSNFTITTYSRQKSLDIFENMEQPVHSETRVLSTFATLTRGRSIVADYAEERVWNGGIKSAQSMERVSVPLVDDRTKFAERNDMLREKVSVHRSKSYITLSSNEKFQNRANEIEKSKEEKKLDDHTNYEIKDSSKRFTSLANVNQSTNDEIPRHKEKFSQWRDNILRKQEEPSKEKQLQSLQVLKSILPQLKNAQATEENGYKSTSDNFTIKKRQEPQCEEPQETPTVSSTTPDVQLRVNRRPQEPSKRYTYGGPPAVSLGSWSERPCVNVQIKTDTDYKFGGKNNPNHSTSGAKTVVNLNGGGSHTVEEKSERMQKENGVTSQESKEPMVVHTKPVVAERDDESRVDTTSVNFRELTKAFGQDVRLRPKPPVRNPHNRLSEYLERPKPEVIASKQNGFAEPHVTTTTFNHNLRNTNGPVPPVKRYTSVVGITNNNNTVNNNNVNHIGANNNNNKVHHANGASNFRFTNGSAPKPTVTTAATKGLIQKEKEYTVPKPPTMPIITGVTLKSVNARPKSSPPMVQADPRDQLLESIRNFGGRQKLRSTAEKY
ncbi:uncharacterized protein LOC100123943 isoform X3 [Nasonia vitripennis]|uniref:WH2 domain-containing protein n=2 Tax=Nasonia vitripennis TaxID=7425 RepID=A0A7M7QM67_NASVI|nr:uncharacterized protein LOC100123943 isoform X3 [Nasonia vitripennis]